MRLCGGGSGHPLMQAGREPVRNLVYVAAERAVKDVNVDGIQRVADGKVRSLDYEDAVARINEARQRTIAQVPELDRKNCTPEQLAPLTFAVQKVSEAFSAD